MPVGVEGAAVLCPAVRLVTRARAPCWVEPLMGRAGGRRHQAGTSAGGAVVLQLYTAAALDS